jgi:hypothetical protein
MGRYAVNKNLGEKYSMAKPNRDRKGNAKFCCFKSTMCGSKQVVGRKKGGAGNKSKFM